MKKIIVVLPAYNEEENIERAAMAMVEVAETLGLDDYEVIVREFLLYKIA